MSKLSTDQTGLPDPQNLSASKTELDPWGNDVGLGYQSPDPPPQPEPMPRGGFGFEVDPQSATYPDGRRIQCVVDGTRLPCANAWNILFHGGGSVDGDRSDRHILAQFNSVEHRERQAAFVQLKYRDGSVRFEDPSVTEVAASGDREPYLQIIYKIESSWEFASFFNPFGQEQQNLIVPLPVDLKAANH